MGRMVFCQKRWRRLGWGGDGGSETGGCTVAVWSFMGVLIFGIIGRMRIGVDRRNGTQVGGGSFGVGENSENDNGQNCAGCAWNPGLSRVGAGGGDWRIVSLGRPGVWDDRRGTLPG